MGTLTLGFCRSKNSGKAIFLATGNNITVKPLHPAFHSVHDCTGHQHIESSAHAARSHNVSWEPRVAKAQLTEGFRIFYILGLPSAVSASIGDADTMISLGQQLCPPAPAAVLEVALAAGETVILLTLPFMPIETSTTGRGGAAQE